jgi:DNA-binding response OmpR family regulator
MKRILTLISVSALFLFACTNNSSNDKTINTLNTKEVKQVTKPFSDTAKADTFRVVLVGSKPKEMQLSFSIITYNGKKIYQKDLKATELLNNYRENVDLKKDAAQLKFLHEELNQFLDEENFLEPAITDAEQPDQNTVDKAFYAELKKSGLNGFKYRLGKESQLYIAWSEKEQKVKVYYKCC